MIEPMRKKKRNLKKRFKNLKITFHDSAEKPLIIEHVDQFLMFYEELQKDPDIMWNFPKYCQILSDLYVELEETEDGDESSVDEGNEEEGSEVGDNEVEGSEEDGGNENNEEKEELVEIEIKFSQSFEIMKC